MYTLILSFLLIGGHTAVAKNLTVTHVAGFQTKAACEAAIVKARTKFAHAVGPQPMNEGGYVHVHGLCLKVGVAKP